MSIAELSEQNPWWREKKLIDEDHLVTIWQNSSFKWEPRISKTFDWNVNVIYSLRGPRQVGKTTLLKLKIRELLKRGIAGRRIFYWTCDQVGTSEKLSSLIDQYVKWARKFTKDRLFLFLDEISAVKDWQQGIKFLYDNGKLKDCLLVLTGSHSLDLVKTTESLAGRRGEVEKLSGNTPDKIFLSAKFAEYVETRDPEIHDVLRTLHLLSTQNRLQLIHNLAKGEIPELLYDIQPFLKILEGFLDEFLVTGGIPRAVNSYISQGKIPEIIYSDYVSLILRDILRWGGNEIFLRQIINRIIETMTSRISWNALKNNTEISTHDTARWYVEMLKNSFVISYIYRLKESKGVPYYKKAKKIYFEDPFIFHALRWWVYGRSRPFENSLNFLKDSENKSKLLESVLCNHLIRFLFDLQPSPQFDYSTKLFYWVSGKNREVDFVAKLDTTFLPIELKYQSKIHKHDSFGIIDFTKSGSSEKGIILTKDAFEQRRKHVEIPFALFLFLI